MSDEGSYSFLERRSRTGSVGESPKKTQVERLIRMGFDSSVGTSDIDYEASIPEMPPRPLGNGQTRLTFPVLVEPRLTLGQCLQIAEIEESLTGTAEARFLLAKECVEFSEEPYWIWCGIYSKSAEKALGRSQSGTRWITATEGVFLALHYRGVLELRDHITCLGSRYIDGDEGEKVVVVEATLREQVVDRLAFGLVSRVFRKEKPGAGLRMASLPIKGFLQCARDPVACAWPSGLD